jgi:hypothetical protein
MIHSISLTNFQSHRETVLDLDKGINVLVGSSDSGKTAILRALYWVVENRPLGDAFVSRWARDDKGKQTGSTIVEVRKGKRLVTRVRGSGENFYGVGDDKLEATRGEVPRAVEEFFNLSSVNLQKQLDAPFLLSSTAGEVARFLNSILKLDEIDTVLSAVDGRRRKTVAGIAEEERLIEERSKMLQTFTWLERGEALLEKAAMAEERLASRRRQENRAREILESLEEASGRVLAAATTEAVGAIVETAEEVRAKMARTASAAEKAAIILERLSRLQREVRRTERRTGSETLVREAITIAEDLDRARKRATSMDRILTSGGVLSTEVLERRREITRLEKEMPEVCPLCGGPLK